MYSWQRIDLEKSEYDIVDNLVTNTETRLIKIHGNSYAVNDMRYMGTIAEAPESKKSHTSIPAAQQMDTPFDVLRLLGTGELTPKASGLKWGMYDSQKFRELAKKQWDAHVARRPMLNGIQAEKEARIKSLMQSV